MAGGHVAFWGLRRGSLRFRELGLGSRVLGELHRVWGLGSKVLGYSGFQGLGFRV